MPWLIVIVAGVFEMGFALGGVIGLTISGVTW